MGSPRLLGRIFGPNGVAVVRINPGEVARVLVADGDEFTAVLREPGTYQVSTESLAPGRQLETFPIELWAMDARQALFIDFTYRRMQGPLSVGWARLRKAAPSDPFDHLAGMFESILTEAILQSPDPPRDAADYRRRLPHAVPALIQRFLRGQKYAEGQVATC